MGKKKSKSYKPRQQEAKRNDSMQKYLLFAGCCLAVVAIVVVVLLNRTEEVGRRTFVSGANFVSLLDDNTFVAQLPHGLSKNGTYDETLDEETGITFVRFFVDGRNEIGTIQEDLLTIPSEWDDGHGHSVHYRLQ